MARQADIDEANDEKNKMSADEKGIQWDRSCTDMLCCLIFLVFIASMVGITGYAVSNGDPYKIITPFDSVGNRCGAENMGVDYVPVNVTDFSEYKLKHFTSLFEAIQNPLKIYESVCVKECPKKGDTPDCKTNGDVSSCSKSYFDTTEMHGYCLPSKETLETTLKKVYEEMNKEANFAKYIADLQICWPAIAGMAGATAIISIVYIFLLKWFVKPILYISMVLILIFFVLLGGWAWMKKDEYDPELEKENYQYAQIGAYVSWGLAVIYALFMCCCFNNIRLGASIMEAASEFVSSNIRIVSLPILAYLICVPFMAYWTISAVYLYSIGEPEYQKNSLVANIKWEESTNYLMWYFLFGLFWCVAFFICLQQFMIAAMTCMWYFSGQGEEMSDTHGEVSLCMALRWGAWYHCGSIAFGAFLIAVITMIRVVFEYIAKKYEQVGNKDNALYKAVACCIRCILWCLDKYVKFITKNAFIQIALRNTNFCSAAWQSFYLIIRHAGRFSSALVIGWIMMMLGKGTIMASSAYLTLLVVQYSYPNVQQPFIPAVIILLVAYLVGSLFLSIFSFACTAILHCFIMDEDTGGSKSTPKALEGFLSANDEGNKQKESGKKENPVE